MSQIERETIQELRTEVDAIFDRMFAVLGETLPSELAFQTRSNPEVAARPAAISPINQPAEVSTETSGPEHGLTNDVPECSICHEPYNSGSQPEIPLTLSCGHAFGSRCLPLWLHPADNDDGSATCPLCRTTLFSPPNQIPIDLDTEPRDTVQEFLQFMTAEERATYDIGLAELRAGLYEPTESDDSESSLGVGDGPDEPGSDGDEDGDVFSGPGGDLARAYFRRITSERLADTERILDARLRQVDQLTDARNADRSLGGFFDPNGEGSDVDDWENYYINSDGVIIGRSGL